jgi:nucleoside-diphosphate-sugar epimerase
MKKKYQILVTGAAGYLGSMLCTELVSRGYIVTAVDKLKYDKNSLCHLFFFKKNFKFIKADVTKINIIKKIIKNKDFIIPLAGLVGAPLCERKKSEAVKINVNAIKLIMKFIKQSQKIIYPTSNSGYGIGQKSKFCDENSPLNPISLYGRTKVEAEKIVIQHANFVAFRLATVFGYSYRMRTDLIVNNFVEKAVKSSRLDIFEPKFRRNFIHIKDVIRGFVFAIENFKIVKNNIFNLGLSSANITKIQLAQKIKKNLKKTKIVVNRSKSDPDKRDYFVSNKKIEKKGFKAKISLEDGIEELKKIFINCDIKFNNNY